MLLAAKGCNETEAEPEMFNLPMVVVGTPVIIALVLIFISSASVGNVLEGVQLPAVDQLPVAPPLQV
jgi:hypothetical protein